MNPALDLEAEVEWVAPDVKLRCAEPRIDAGGGGVNVARALHRIGGKATALFPEGADLGPFYRSLVEAEGVDCHTFEIDQPMRRINSHFRDMRNQRQYRFCLPGAKLEESVWRRTLELLDGLLKEGDILVASGSLSPGVPADFNARTAKTVKGKQACFVLDAPGEVLKALKQTAVGWITPNQDEFEDLLGHEVADGQLEKALAAFVEDSAFENILLTLGSRGALYAGTQGFARIPALEVEKLSSVGAGDSAVAGLVFGLAQGKNHRTSSRMAVAAGTAAVKSPGTELLEKEDFVTLFDAMNDTQASSQQ